MSTLKELANAVRFLSVDMIEKAHSGHPGVSLGMADFITVLWNRFLKISPSHPSWANRDRFILSGGHASSLLYSLLYLSGFKDISLEDLQNFRQIDSKTAGHPEYKSLQGIEATTGPLGQGLAMGVGMALSEKIAQNRFGSQVINHKIYVCCGDGDLMEGISEEAISFSGHLKLNNLIVLWDNNSITIDGSTDIATHTKQTDRFKANGWNVLEIDGHNFLEIEKALSQAQSSLLPTMISCRTTIGYGAPTKAGSSISHGAPLGAEEIQGLRNNLKWPYPAFEIPTEILNQWREIQRNGENRYQEWKNLNAEFLDSPDKQKQLNFEIELNLYKEKLVSDRPEIASRKSSQKTLEEIIKFFPDLIGGSADLSASNLTKTSYSKTITPDDFSGNYIEYGIREHLMGALMNGIALHGFFKPYGGTFFVFADYLKPALRLSALMQLPVIYVFTHDSIGVGEDGPTHQPIEQLAMLRSIPHLSVLRPADALECAESWEIALKNKGPTALILSRQNLPFLRKQSSCNKTEKGAYIISPAQKQKTINLVATGSEVALAIEVQKELALKNIYADVISMPSWDLFEKQPQLYKESVLDDCFTFSIEAGATFGWAKYADKSFGIDHFGSSGPAQKVFEKSGLTVKNVLENILDIVELNKKKGK